MYSILKHLLKVSLALGLALPLCASEPKEPQDGKELDYTNEAFTEFQKNQLVHIDDTTDTNSQHRKNESIGTMSAPSQAQFVNRGSFSTIGGQPMQYDETYMIYDEEIDENEEPALPLDGNITPLSSLKQENICFGDELPTQKKQSSLKGNGHVVYERDSVINDMIITPPPSQRDDNHIGNGSTTQGNLMDATANDDPSAIDADSIPANINTQENSDTQKGKGSRGSIERATDGAQDTQLHSPSGKYQHTGNQISQPTYNSRKKLQNNGRRSSTGNEKNNTNNPPLTIDIVPNVKKRGTVPEGMNGYHNDETDNLKNKEATAAWYTRIYLQITFRNVAILLLGLAAAVGVYYRKSLQALFHKYPSS